MLDDRAYLRRCGSIYEALIARMERRREPEERAEWIELIARFAWEHPPGRFADGALETPLIALGEELRAQASKDLPRPLGAQRYLIHVVTRAPAVGGHVRLLIRWIERDDDSAHSVVLLSQGKTPIPLALSEAVSARGGQILSLKEGGSRLERAARLRGVTDGAGADGLVLHTNPDDVVAVLAFAREGGPPIAVMNHADHVFWLGASVARCIVNFRGYAAELSAKRRFGESCPILPLPIDPGRPQDRRQVRAKLGIGEDEVLLLSMGSAYKFAARKEHNFFRASARILEDQPSARLIIVGLSSEDKVPGQEGLHPRALPVGIQADPSIYQAAADLYLDHVPYGSLMAALESIAAGLPPILMYAPSASLRFDDDPGFCGRLRHPDDEAAYVAEAVALIRDAERRRELSAVLAPAMRSEHGGAGWRASLEAVYEAFLGQSHRPRSLPISPFLAADADLDMSAASRARARSGPVCLDIERDAPGPSDILSLAYRSWSLGDSRARHLGKWLTRFRRSLRRRR